MLEKVDGIVLKTFTPGAGKNCLFTQSQGKVICTIFNPQQTAILRMGSRISYTPLRYDHGAHITAHITVTNMPGLTTPSDLAWVHHLLELCYYFAPLQQPASEIFALLTGTLFFNNHQLLNDHEYYVFKRLSIGSLLTLMGFYPPHDFAEVVLTTQRLLTTNIDFKAHTNIELLKYHATVLTRGVCKVYDAWLLECIHTHPRIAYFKTLPFVYQLPTAEKRG